jgi:hypothetical protein
MFGIGMLDMLLIALTFIAFMIIRNNKARRS